MAKHVTNSVTGVKPGSLAFRAGIQKRDKIISINKKKIHDELDFIFYSQEPILDISIRRGDKTLKVILENEDLEDTGMEIEPLRVMTCKNNCIFCFVNQLPKGLRRSLYIKDEDYRLSFLQGNYVTLSNLSESDRKRIIEQKMSPLYISVHTTNHELRQKMLNNKKAPDILSDLRLFKSHKIRFHVQIVLCPGNNDKKELEKTLTDLIKFYPYLVSIAVVPVGITRHRKKPIKPVEIEDAREAIQIIEKYQKRFSKKFGDPIVYGSDELYIKADHSFPPLKLYGDLPQIENGVGMVPSFLHKSRFLRLSSYSFSKKKFLTLTGTSFYTFLAQFIHKLREKSGAHIEVAPVANSFFGESVTVTGLLTGRDIIKTLSNWIDNVDVILVPDVVLRDCFNVLLDDVTLENLQDALNREVKVIESTPSGLIRGLEGKYDPN